MESYNFHYVQVSHCFPQDLVEFPQELIDILQRHPTNLNHDMRKVYGIFTLKI